MAYAYVSLSNINSTWEYGKNKGALSREKYTPESWPSTKKAARLECVMQTTAGSEAYGSFMHKLYYAETN